MQPESPPAARILAMGDLHVGGTFGLWPPGQERGQNKIQKYIWRCFCDVAQKVSGITHLFLMGDLVEGGLAKSEAGDVWEPRKATQVLALQSALQRLTPTLTRDAEVIIIAGSRYHVGVQGEHEQLAAKIVQSLGWNVRAFGDTLVTPWYVGRVGPIVVDAAHRQGRNIVYKTQPLEREVQFARIRGANPGILLRAHNHRYSKWEDERTIAVSCPPFKAMDTFAATTIYPNGYAAFSIGALTIDIYHSNAKPNFARVTSYLYDPVIVYDQRRKK